MSTGKARYWVWRQPATGGQRFSVWQVCDAERDDVVIATYDTRREARAEVARRTLQEAQGNQGEGR